MPGNGGVKLYCVIYIFRVPRKNVEAFLRIQGEASEIYLRYGSLGEETLASTGSVAKYGCIPFFNTVELNEDEDIFLSISHFRDKAHHDQVMAQIDLDPNIDRLYREITNLVDIDRVVRGEFKQVI
jgi:uncharacterized protein YbaA (DUF1428 family)